MGDMGDMWREQREFKRSMRRVWTECSSPGCQFGGNPVKVAPGETCRHCGVRAPGSVGEDIQYARQDEQRRAEEAATAERKRKHRLALRTCPKCGKMLKNEQGRVNHDRDFHGASRPEARKT